MIDCALVFAAMMVSWDGGAKLAKKRFGMAKSAESEILAIGSASLGLIDRRCEWVGGGYIEVVMEGKRFTKLLVIWNRMT